MVGLATPTKQSERTCFGFGMSFLPKAHVVHQHARQWGGEGVNAAIREIGCLLLGFGPPKWLFACPSGFPLKPPNQKRPDPSGSIFSGGVVLEGHKKKV